jgi:putative restriction endonuclease
LVGSHFPDTIAPDVLSAVGLDPDAVLHAADAVPDPSGSATRRRDPNWRETIMQAWDRQCAFCGFDGQVLGATVGVDAAHVRWFALDGPDEPDNGLALCALHHKLFDRGVLGVDLDLRIQVSTAFTARTTAGRAVYELHGGGLQARPGTAMPAEAHLRWHRRWVFKDDRWQPDEPDGAASAGVHKIGCVRVAPSDGLAPEPARAAMRLCGDRRMPVPGEIEVQYPAA